MHTRLIFGICLFFVNFTVLAADGLNPAELFEHASPSIVVTNAIGPDGNAVAQGSGVVIANNIVVSNCHVFAKADSIIVSYQKENYPATLRFVDITHDLCSLDVKDLPAPPIKLGSTSDLKVGQKVYAIGAPKGLTLSLSGGLISSLRHISDGTIIQTTAAISPGSSGGGLFDSHGRLIGITAFQITEGDLLNFALPVEWIKSLPQRGKTPKEFARAQASQDSKNITISPELLKAYKAYLIGDYATALATLKPLAQEGNPYAEFLLGGMYEFGNGVSQNYRKAVYWYQKAATQENVDSQVRLGVLYADGHGVPQNYSKAIYWYKKAAIQGDANAQFNLGFMYAQGQGVLHDSSKAVYWFQKAAEQELAKAQFAMAVQYLLGQGVPQDTIQAAKWLILANAGGFPTAEKRLSGLEEIMTTTEIAEAQHLASEWWIKHHKE